MVHLYLYRLDPLSQDWRNLFHNHGFPQVPPIRHFCRLIRIRTIQTSSLFHQRHFKNHRQKFWSLLTCSNKSTSRMLWGRLRIRLVVNSSFRIKYRVTECCPLKWIWTTSHRKLNSSLFSRSRGYFSNISQQILALSLHPRSHRFILAIIISNQASKNSDVQLKCKSKPITKPSKDFKIKLSCKRKKRIGRRRLTRLSEYGDSKIWNL